MFLFTPQEFGIEIIKTDKKGATYICLRFLGIPIKFPIKSDGKSKKAKTEKKEFSFSTFKEKVLSLKEVYDSSKDELKKTLSFARRELTVKNVDFRIHFGLDNAAATGISTGAVWGVGSILLKIIDSLIGIKKINMKVDPDFDNKVFEIYSKNNPQNTHNYKQYGASNLHTSTKNASKN